MRPGQVADIRPEGSGPPLPDGWVAQPVRWNGQAMEVAFNPQRYKVARFTAHQMDRGDRRRLFGQAGWRQVGVDREGAELWIADRAQVQRSRLDRLGAQQPAVPSQSVVLG
jgi:hypothetical protein